MSHVATIGTFDRTIDKMLTGRLPRKRTATWYDGKLHRAIACASKTPAGRQYNRLVRLAIRIGSRRVYNYGDRRLGNS